MGAPSSTAAVREPFSLLFIPNASNIKAFLFMALLWLLLPGFRPCCFSRGLTEVLLSLETIRALTQDKSTVRTLSHKGLYSQIQRIVATDIQDFILTPLLTCHVTLGHYSPWKSSIFTVPSPMAQHQSMLRSVLVHAGHAWPTHRPSFLSPPQPGL